MTALELKVVDHVELTRRQQRLRRVLDEIPGVLKLAEGAGTGIGAAGGERSKHLEKEILIAGRLAEGWQLGTLWRLLVRGIADASDPPELFAFSKAPGKLEHGLLPHAVDQDVGLCVEEHGSADAVGPEVVVRDPSGACLDPAQDDGAGALEEAFDEVGVGDESAVGPAVVDAAGGVVVALAALARGRIVRHHRINAAAGHPPEKTRLAQSGDVMGFGDIRLGDHSGPEARIHEHTADERGSGQGMVDVAVAGDQDHIRPVPSQGVHLFSRGRQKHREKSIEHIPSPRNAPEIERPEGGARQTSSFSQRGFAAGA
ncbi:MAG: hypothetical protein BWZ01_02692 [Deltaproteobacteria bacterium ADurb.BinA179]|nr:MAG: hypothetical protein BWZ01_02692 [Deltaproteobacteria bacterium ADurb.BinA179]